MRLQQKSGCFNLLSFFSETGCIYTHVDYRNLLSCQVITASTYSTNYTKFHQQFYTQCYMSDTCNKNQTSNKNKTNTSTNT